jgi:uncharacterized SAM-binding protein YcdF (DUF218 family)
MLPVLLLLAIASAAGIWLWLHRERRGPLWRWAWLVPVAALAVLAVLVGSDADLRLYLQKVGGMLLMPAGLCWLLLLGLTAAALLAGRWWSAGLACAAWLLYTASGSIWLGTALLASLEGQVLPGPDLATVEPFDAVFVLGGGTERMPDGSPSLGEAGDRVLIAARLHLAGKAPVLVTGGSSIDGARDLGSEVRSLWRGVGVSDSAVVLEPLPRITRDEIARYHALAQERGWKRVGVISSAWHLPRVLDHCRRLGWTVVAIPGDARSRPYPTQFLYFIPQSRGFDYVQTACWERLGRLIGR